jgi:hypothetical protein
MLSTTTRLALGVVGAVLAFAGLAATAAGAGFSGLWVTAMGAALIVAVVIERQRYRSEAADRTFEPSGPGGGEPPGSIEPRFQPTDELFVDPTTSHLMRVHVDPRTGERRYVAEG